MLSATQMLSAMPVCYLPSPLCYLPIRYLANPFQETSDEEHDWCTFDALSTSKYFVSYLVSQQHIHTVSNSLQIPVKCQCSANYFV